LTNIYWGDVEDASLRIRGLSAQGRLDAFMEWLVGSFYIAKLGGEYGHIEAGSLHESVFMMGDSAPRAVWPSDVERLISSLVSDRAIPENTSGNEVYAVFLPRGSTAYVTDDHGHEVPSCPREAADRSCFCGYHGWYEAPSRRIERYYLVIPDLTGAPGWCGGPGDNLGDRTVSASHELAEVVTDPGGRGWYSDGAGGDEIGDFCQGDNRGRNIYRHADTMNFWVQCEFSDRQQGCVQGL
jgi:hypothetical protein